MPDDPNEADHSSKPERSSKPKKIARKRAKAPAIIDKNADDSVSAAAALEAGVSPPEAGGRNEKWTVGIAALAIGVVCLAALMFLPKLARSSAKNLHKPAPEFALPIVMNGDEGARFALKDLKGQAVLLDFWAFWCEPCRRETPVIDRLAAKYKDRGLTVLGVSVEGDDETVRQAATAFKMHYPVLLDDGSVQRQYNVTKLPTLVLVDREGNVVASSEGMVDEASVEEMIREVL